MATEVPTEIFLEKMSWPEVEERLKESDIVIVNTGSTEQHGKHLPLNTDAFIVKEIVKRAAVNVLEDVKLTIAPLIPIGVSTEHINYPGTITMSINTFTNVIQDVCHSLISHGFKKLIIVNGHTGQGQLFALYHAMANLKQQFGAKVVIFIINIWEFLSEVGEKLREVHSEWPTEHAGEIETSIAMALGNPAVKLNKAVDTNVKPEWVNLPEDIDWDWFKSLKPLHSWSFPTFKNRGPEVAAVGSIGFPTRATKEKGEKIVKSAIENLASFLRKVKEINLNNSVS